MIDLYGYDHVYECVPPVSFNKGAEDPVKVHMKVAPSFEVEHQTRIEQALEAEARSKRAQEFVASKVVKIENLRVDGKEVTSYQQLRQTGPNELIRWIAMAVFSEQVLKEAEVKN